MWARAALVAAAAAGTALLQRVDADDSCGNRRPDAGRRTFQSRAVDEGIEAVASRMDDRELACLFKNTFPNSLDTTVYRFLEASPDGGPALSASGVCAQTPGLCSMKGDSPVEDDAFVVTGDIPAMWLRDSTNQVLPYMRFAHYDTRLKALLRGLLRRQVRQIHTDAYANAHNLDRSMGQTPNAQDQTTMPSFLGTSVSAMTPLIFERKYELDSLCAFLKLGAEYYAATVDATPFDKSWSDAVSIVVSVMRSQQKSTEEDDGTYSFQRCSSCEPTDTLLHGRGAPAARTGLIRSAFRPSDDATQYPFLVPANAMAVVELRRTAKLVRKIQGDIHAALPLEELASEVDTALSQVAIVAHPTTREQVYAYEVDGFGNAYHMDDANVPSLLSLPYLGYLAPNNSVYLATRKVVLNKTMNPYFFEGSAGFGVGSPHTGFGRIWPMSVIIQALTSEDDDEIRRCLQVLKTTTDSKWFMHESFWKDDASSFSRPWFAWANSLFGELIMRLSASRPHLLFSEQALHF